MENLQTTSLNVRRGFQVDSHYDSHSNAVICFNPLTPYSFYDY